MTQELSEGFFPAPMHTGAKSHNFQVRWLCAVERQGRAGLHGLPPASVRTMAALQRRAWRRVLSPLPLPTGPCLPNSSPSSDFPGAPGEL